MNSDQLSMKFFPVLTGDIGGTNSRLEIIQLCKDFKTPAKSIIKKTLSSPKYPNITGLLKEFLAELQGTNNYPVISVLGIPGPVFDNRVEILANLNWKDVDGDQLAKDLNLKQMVLLNDFVVNGYGILSDIKEGEDYERLNDVPVHQDSPIAMIGAGTGLGYGYLVKNAGSKYYEVYPSEGGHQDFAPQNETEWEYFKYLQNRFNVKHISVERACSGPSLKVMFQFFIEKFNINSTLFTEKKSYENIENEEILDAGLNKRDEACVKTLELFITIYAAASGNMSLVLLPFGGLYLLGGLTVKLENYIIKEKLFRENFTNKGRLEPMMNKIPLFVVKNSHIGVKGSREYARRILENLEKESEN